MGVKESMSTKKQALDAELAHSAMGPGGLDTAFDDEDKEFDVYYREPDGEYNHSIVQASYISEAIDYIEAAKGGEVWKAEIREKDKKSEGPGPKR